MQHAVLTNLDADSRCLAWQAPSSHAPWQLLQATPAVAPTVVEGALADSRVAALEMRVKILAGEAATREAMIEMLVRGYFHLSEAQPSRKNAHILCRSLSHPWVNGNFGTVHGDRATKRKGQQRHCLSNRGLGVEAAGAGQPRGTHRHAAQAEAEVRRGPLGPGLMGARSVQAAIEKGLAEITLPQAMTLEGRKNIYSLEATQARA